MNIHRLAGLVPALIVFAPCMAQEQPVRDTYKPNSSDQAKDMDRQNMQDRAQDRSKDMDKGKSRQDARAATLIKGKNVIGAKVVNKADENLGKIDDLLIDTRNGYAVFGVISEGGVLGIGDKLIAVPWRAFDVLPNSDGDATVVLDTTKEQLKNAPSFDKKDWPLIGERSWMTKAHDYFKAEPSWRDSGTGGWGRDSAVTRDWSKGQDMDVKGTVERVDHSGSGRGMSESTTLVVKGDDGQEHTVTLGPSWFINGQEMGFKAGDQVEIHAHQTRVHDTDVIVARDVTVQGNNLVLRDQSGMPVWDSSTMQAGDVKGAGDAFIRCSELNGKNVQGTGDKKIADVKEEAIDPHSGRIPFLVLSVGGLAGVGNHEVVVPWNAVSFVKQGDKLALSSDENTLKSAPQLGKGGFAMVNDPQFRQQVYSFYGPSRLYGMPEPMAGDNNASPAGHDEAWGTGSPYNKLYTGSPITITGTVQDVSTASPMKGMSNGATLTIQTDAGTKTVQVGPSWYVSRQDLRFLKGDQVTVTGVPATIDGNQVIMASEIKSSNGTLKLRDEQGRPEWDAWHNSNSK